LLHFGADALAIISIDLRVCVCVQRGKSCNFTRFVKPYSSVGVITVVPLYVYRFRRLCLLKFCTLHVMHTEHILTVNISNQLVLNKIHSEECTLLSVQFARLCSVWIT
jgi:hypothetical protein